MSETSHLTRGAWIEMTCLLSTRVQVLSRTSHEVRGLKLVPSGRSPAAVQRRTSHEVRGLKLLLPVQNTGRKRVAPHTRCVD